MGLGGFIGEMKRIWNYAGSIGYIAGDDTALHGRADTWRAMADELRSARDQLDHIAATQLRGGEGGNWNDPASDAFRAAWSREAAHFGELASQYDAMAKALHDAGHEVTNFNHATKMVLLEIGAWIAVTVALAAIPGVDLAEEGIAAARAAMLISRWGRLAIWIIRLWSSARKWFAINLLILYGSRFAERWIKLGDPTKGWTKNDAVQLTTSAAVASVLGGALALPGAMLRSSRLAVLAEDLAGGRLAAGTPLVKGSAAAAQVAAAGFRTRVPLLLRWVPGIDGAMGVVDEVPTLRTVSDALTAGGRPGVGSLFRIEPENRLLASPKLLPALFATRVPSFLTGSLAPGAAGASPFALWTGRMLNARPLNAVLTATTFNWINARFIAHTPYTWTGSEWSAGASVIVVALNRGLFGGALPLPATASSVLVINGALEIASPAVARSRGVNFRTELSEVTVIDGRAFAVTPAGVVPAGGPPIHTVQPGDTLFDIARSQYGSGSYYTDIARRNHVPNPDLIHPGQTVVLPPVDPNQPTPPSPPPPVPRPAAPAASSPAPHASAAYDVRDHDSLWSIARRAYGDGSRWGDIARANHLHGTTIRQGERLWIPPLAGAARH